MRSYQPPSRGHSGQIRKAIDELLLLNALLFILVVVLFKVMLLHY
jgi:hypothetical protein